VAICILVHKRGYYGAQHVKGGIAQFLDGEITGKRRTAVQDSSPLSDVYRLIPYALEFYRDPQGADNESQIPRHRLIESEKSKRVPVHFDFQQIDFSIPVKYFLGQVIVPFHKGLYRFFQGFFGQGRHLEDCHFELFKIGVKSGFHF